MKKKFGMGSISRQFTTIFVLVMAGAFFTSWLLTNVFLEKFYVMNQEKELLAMYELMDGAARENRFQEESFKKQLQEKCTKVNLDVLVVDADSKVITYAGNNPELTKMLLWDRLFMGKNQEETTEEILKETEFYRIQTVYDRRLENQNIIMWGSLSNGNIFLIRTPLESIQESVRLASEFMVKIGIFSVIVFGSLIWAMTKKMTKPILNLVDISHRMSQLDFEACYEGNAKNEISLLGENMNSMSATLKKTISELKEANVELKKDIEVKNQLETMRNEFLSNVSHELKTPIALIQGYAEGLQEGFLEDEESRNYYCSVICDEVGKMNQIVQKMLTLNELEFGQNTVEMERFDLTELIQGQLKLSAVILEQNKITINFIHEKPVYVWGDPYLISEVFNNYLTNAIHYCNNEKLIDIKIEQDGEHARVVVFNTGNEIPEESIPCLWDQFYKVDKARTRSYGGNGVGLSIVKAIMESMGQKYGVQNYENGVAFYFELDLK